MPMRRVGEYRSVLALSVSALGGTLGLRAYPFPADNAVVALIHLERPLLYGSFTYAYAVLWFSSCFFLASIGVSCLYIFVGRGGHTSAAAPLPPYPAADGREDLYVVLGEQHHRTSAERAERPTWLTIPERGLYTGILVVGAIGSGKTSACMYPYIEQLLAYRANDPGTPARAPVHTVPGSRSSR